MPTAELPLGRYEKLLRMAMHPNTPPPERAIAAKQVAKLEAAHPGIRQAYLRKVAIEQAQYRMRQGAAAAASAVAGAAHHAQGLTTEQRMVFAAQQALDWGLGALWEEVRTRASTFAQGFTHPALNTEDDDMNEPDTEETVNVGTLDWADPDFDLSTAVRLEAELFESDDDEVGDIFGGEIEMPVGLLHAAAENPKLAAALCAFLLDPGEDEDTDETGEEDE